MDEHNDANRTDHPPELRKLNASSLADAHPIPCRYEKTTLHSLADAHPLPCRYENITLHRGSLVDTGADCVVNAANEVLQGGGGVDEVIHGCASAGLSLHLPDTCPLCVECRALFPVDAEGARVRPGKAVTTSAYGITAARFVVHTVAPYLDEAGRSQPELLAACYKNALRAAQSVKAKSMVYPALGTGFYGYPMLEAGRVAISAITEFFEDEAGCWRIPVILAGRGPLSCAILARLLGEEVIEENECA